MGGGLYSTDYRYLEQTAVALGMTSITVLIHYGGMSLVRHCYRRARAITGNERAFVLQGVMILIVLIMMLTHTAEVFLWGLLYYLQGMVPDWWNAFYFSVANYSTIGASDVSLHGRWHGLGGFESICAMLMFGWSTALLAAVIVKIHSLDE
jgi:hypothetical protein